MGLRVVGAGVGRTGTHSLKLALEQLLGTPCHHMMEMFPDPAQQAAWIDAVDGKPVDWHAMLARYGAQVDWPGASFWPELVAAFPDALVLLSVRDPEGWYRSASNTVFPTIALLSDAAAGDASTRCHRRSSRGCRPSGGCSTIASATASTTRPR